MITIQNSQAVFVGTDGGELGLFQPGTWQVPSASYVASGTNAAVSLVGLRSGSVVLVDSGGLVRVVPGPDLVWAVGWGFGTALMTVGMILGLRRLVRGVVGSVGISKEGVD